MAKSLMYMHRKLWFLFPAFLFFNQLVQAQDVINRQSIDYKGMLILSPLVKIEATQAVNDMYNFKFKKAANQFNWFKDKYPDHPLPYFLLGLNTWWQMMPNTDNEQYDKAFQAYMDSSITYAKRIYNRDRENAEASFFLAAAYAFKSRLNAERKNWTKAAFAGKNALAYLRRSNKLNELSPEFLFGDALYNYYSVWIPKNYPALKPIMLFFKKGDQNLGLKQLEEVSEDAFYTKTEAQYFLMRIYQYDQKQPYKAYRIAHYLHQTFPDNAYFHRLYASYTYSIALWEEAQNASMNILQKINAGMPGYEAVSGRYASFILGYIQKNRYGNAKKAEEYFQQAVNYTEQSASYESGYYHSALYELAKMAEQGKDYALAKKYYESLKKHTKRKSNYNKEAKKFIKKNKKVE